MKIGAIIQARSSSSRLAKKVLKPLPFGSDICVLQQVIRRVLKSELLDEVIVATSTNEEDLDIVEVAKKENVPYYCGSLDNVLERYYNAAVKAYNILIHTIPSNIVASILGYKDIKLYEATEEQRKNVTVDFSE